MARAVATINSGWSFARGDSDEGPAGLPVSLPHTNVIVPAQGFDDASYQFVARYQRTLRLPVDRTDCRVFVDFDGVMTAATVTLNDSPVGEHEGGFVPFSCELTDAVRWGRENRLTVLVDSAERPDIPPFGGHIDYLAFGGIYRDARVRIVPRTFIADVFAEPLDVLGPRRRIDVHCSVEMSDGMGAVPLRLEVAVLDGAVCVASASQEIAVVGKGEQTVTVVGLEALELWDLDTPRLYRLSVSLYDKANFLDSLDVHTGLRDARFTESGFHLNGRRVLLRGLNRHQTFPHVGAAMPARMQRRDAEILRHGLKCTAVRSSHYPPSPHFLNACDELGLLVFEEMPGWQHIGEERWQDLACRDVDAMVRRDRNHPSVILWGVRINESADSPEFYRRTNAIAHALDPSRATSGVRYFEDSELLEDVFALNDFQVDGSLHPPNHPLYLVSEYAGHMFPTKRFDNVERVQEHALLHARVLDTLASDDRYAGGFGWCAFDYNTHAEFGSGDRVCHHGVCDMFREVKPAAAVYRAQCEPDDEVVLEPAFTWSTGDHSNYGGPGAGVILSNCERIEAYVGGVLVAELLPDRAAYPALAHPPFFFDQTSGTAPWRRTWGNLRLDGYVEDRLVVRRSFSGRGMDQDFHLVVDDDELIADGSDTTRVVVRVTDEFGAARPFATGVVHLEVSGPADVVGDNPIALVGGCAAVWLRARHDAGTVSVHATHPVLGRRSVRLQIAAAVPEPW